MSNSFKLKNKNIIITGGLGFLGNQITNALIKENANVYIIDIKQPKQINKKKFFSCDITNEKEVIKVLNFFKLKKKKN